MRCSSHTTPLETARPSAGDRYLGEAVRRPAFVVPAPASAEVGWKDFSHRGTASTGSYGGFHTAARCVEVSLPQTGPAYDGAERTPSKRRKYRVRRVSRGVREATQAGAARILRHMGAKGAAPLQHAWPHRQP